MLRNSNTVRPAGVALRSASAALLLVVAVGCPHRSPEWSPRGDRILLLGGDQGEAVDKAASKLWLVDVKTRAARSIPAPAEGHRFLGVAWLDGESFLALSGEWQGDYVAEGTGAVWRRGIAEEAKWERLKLPVPSEERTPRRPPVVWSQDGRTRVAYPTGFEAVAVVTLGGDEEPRTIEPAELVGPAPGGPGGGQGLLIYAPDDATGDSVLTALDSRLEPRWSIPFAKLRADIAARLGKKPVEIVFNDTSTSHLPVDAPTDEGPSWVAVNLTFSDVGWKDGIVGYHVRLDAATGALLSAQGSICLSGRPTTLAGKIWTVTAPSKKSGTPVAVRAIDEKTGDATRTIALPELGKDDVHGYALDRAGRRLAVSVNGRERALRLYDLSGDAEPVEIPLAD